jgi:hypothetical protein
LIQALVQTPLVDIPYITLKNRLVDSNTLTDFQKIKQLHQMESHGSHKPSELLAQMLKFCP